jgi:hypothetical protein
VIPLADELWRRGIPFLFHTGSPEIEALRARYGGVSILQKGAMSGRVVESLDRLLADRMADADRT